MHPEQFSSSVVREAFGEVYRNIHVSLRNPKWKQDIQDMQDVQDEEVFGYLEALS